jgi:hypothetical protein
VDTAVIMIYESTCSWCFPLSVCVHPCVCVCVCVCMCVCVSVCVCVCVRL